MPFGVIGVVMLAVAWRQQARILAAGALIFGLGGALETYYVLGNRIAQVLPGYNLWASEGAWTLLAVALWVLAVSAWKREVGT